MQRGMYELLEQPYNNLFHLQPNLFYDGWQKYMLQQMSHLLFQ